MQDYLQDKQAAQCTADYKGQAIQGRAIMGGIQAGNKVSEMDFFLSRLEKAVAGLTNNRNALHERISPVLAREVPQACQPSLAEVGRMPSSPVTEQLRSITERIEAESVMLGNILERVTT